MGREFDQPLGRRHDLDEGDALVRVQLDARSGLPIERPAVVTAVQGAWVTVRITPEPGLAQNTMINFDSPHAHDPERTSWARPVEAFTIDDGDDAVWEHFYDGSLMPGMIEPAQPSWRRVRLVAITEPIDTPTVKCGPMLALLYTERDGLPPAPRAAEPPWHVPADVLVFTPTRLSVVRRARSGADLITDEEVARFRAASSFADAALTDDEVRAVIGAVDDSRKGR